MDSQDRYAHRRLISREAIATGSSASVAGSGIGVKRTARSVPDVSHNLAHTSVRGLKILSKVGVMALANSNPRYGPMATDT